MGGDELRDRAMEETRRAYANGRDVIPPRLLAQVQRHWEGLLWVPPRFRRRAKTRGHETRNTRIRRDHRTGLSLSRLSEIYGLSRERIRQILKNGKAKD